MIKRISTAIAEWFFLVFCASLAIIAGSQVGLNAIVMGEIEGRDFWSLVLLNPVIRCLAVIPLCVVSLLLCLGWIGIILLIEVENAIEPL